MNRPLRIAHVITGLNVGGAENALCKLVENIDRTRFESNVVSLLPEGVLGERIRRAGGGVDVLGMRRGVPSPVAFLRLVGLLKRTQPDLVQTWLYHADLVGGLAGAWLGLPVLWNIRNSDLTPEVNGLLTRGVVRVCARLSRRLPAAIVCCAERAREIHERIGYDGSKMLVIPNGFDTAALRPDAAAGAAFRREVGVPEEAFLVGVIARFDPQKDHRGFFAAVQRLTEKNGERPYFVLCGDGMTRENTALSEMIPQSFRDRTFLLGRRMDLPKVYASLDLSVLPSRSGEAFPNVVGEAMACGVPCVVTDVGDAARIVGDTGVVVPPRDPAALAGGMRRIMGMSRDARRALGAHARERVCCEYDIEVMTKRYEALYARWFQRD